MYLTSIPFYQLTNFFIQIPDWPAWNVCHPHKFNSKRRKRVFHELFPRWTLDLNRVSPGTFSGKVSPQQKHTMFSTHTHTNAGQSLDGEQAAAGQGLATLTWKDRHVTQLY